MPKLQSKSSTTRRYKLANFISLNSKIIVKLYATYVKNKRVYKIHLRSRKYSECLCYS